MASAGLGGVCASALALKLAIAIANTTFAVIRFLQKPNCRRDAIGNWRPHADEFSRWAIMTMHRDDTPAFLGACDIHSSDGGRGGE
jgi:hypothetical protein